ncbi:RNA helicase [Ranunculus cassubicifolius]
MAETAAPRYAPEDPSLPKPWKGLVDGSTGFLYFWNPETNVTTYDRPKTSSGRGPSPVPTKSVATPISSSVHVHHSSQGHHRSGRAEEDGRYNGEMNSRPKLAAIPSGRNYQGSRGGSGYSDDLPNGLGSSGNGGRGHSSHGLKSSKAVDSDVGLSTEAYRRKHEITVNGEDVPAPFMSFDSTGFPSEILKEVYSAGFSAPTPIQAQSWPVALQNRDIVAIAKTGSGKTLGYLIPGFIHLKHARNNPQMGPTVLVLSPTRELATQIQVEAVKFSKSSRIACTCLYGGAPKGPQLREIERGVDIVVATPGRLNDILEMRKISLRQVSYLVLDEADRMLDMGFEPQIRKIVNEIPPRRQTLMYTATWPKEVRKIAADLLVNPIQVNIGSIDELVANKSITQHIEVVSPMEKNRRLEQILRSQEPGSKVLVFCSTKKMCDQLTRTITRQFGAAAIHGDKSQSERDYVLNQFRSGKSPILVATDVAARGLDIKDIRVVINYDFPTGIEDYVHRIGRTGRAGATGLAYTFFCEQDAKYASDLIKVLEGANQRVPPQIREMASRGGFGRMRNKWASVPGGGGGRGGGRSNDFSFGGRSGRGPPPSSGGRFDRGGGGGYGGRGHDLEPPRERYGRGFHDGPNEDLHDKYPKSNLANGTRDRVRGRSRSPPPVGGWVRSRSRSRSRSHDRFDGPVPSKSMRRHSPPPKRNSSPPRRSPPLPIYRAPQRKRSPSPFETKKSTSTRSYEPTPRNLVRSPQRGANGHGPLSFNEEEEEEGMIREEPQNDNGDK